MVKALPLPTVLSTSILPPIMVMMFLAMARLKPVPWMPLNVVLFSRSNGSKI